MNSLKPPLSFHIWVICSQRLDPICLLFEMFWPVPISRNFCGIFPTTDAKWQIGRYCNKEQVKSHLSPSSSWQCHNKDAAVWTFSRGWISVPEILHVYLGGSLHLMPCRRTFTLPGIEFFFTKCSLGMLTPPQCYFSICRAALAWTYHALLEASDSTGKEVYSEKAGKNKETSHISSQMCCCVKDCSDIVLSCFAEKCRIFISRPQEMISIVAVQCQPHKECSVDATLSWGFPICLASNES